MHIVAHIKLLALKLVAPIVLASPLVGCGAFEESPPAPMSTPSASNLLADAGFEGLAPGWVAFPPAGANEIGDGTAHSGVSSMALHLSSTVGALAVSQSLNPPAFPEFLSGYYRVDEWPKDGAFLQFVVKAPGGAPDEVREVRFVIAGARLDPETAPQARFVFLSRDQPPTGEWTYFAYPIKVAFEAQTGAIPQAWTSVDVSLEARLLTQGEVTVYFDDLYVGTQAGNPNAPKETTK
jgi:hypothetical protein